MSHTPLEEPADPVTSSRPDTSNTAWRRFRPLLLRLHFYAGVFIGPFILVAACTGLMYALIPQIDSLSTRHERTVEQVGDRALPLARQVAAARAAHPEGTVASIRPPANEHETTQVTLAVDDVPAGYARTVFVDPYTGDIRGALTTFGEWMPVRAWFDELHRNLHLGVVGRNYSELAASWLWAVVVAGVAMWIGHRKRTGALRRLLLADRDATVRRRLISWHGAVGTWLVVALLGLSITGMTWSRFAGASIDALQAQLDTKPPAVDTSIAVESGEPATGGHHGAAHPAPNLSERDALQGVDVALSSAREAGLANPLLMYPPAGADEGWLVAENKRSWPTRYDAISVDPHTGAVTDRADFSDWPLLAKLTDWAIGAHMGILFGLVNQIVLAAVAVGLIVTVLIGYRMWWRRRPTGGGLPAGPRRGALTGLKPAEAVLVVAVLAVVGFFAPAFGVSLATFLALDVAIGWWKSRRPTDARQ